MIRLRRRKKKTVSTKFRLTLGLTLLLLSLLVSGTLFGLIPDKMKLVREGRTALAESIAAMSMALTSEADLPRLRVLIRTCEEARISG